MFYWKTEKINFRTFILLSLVLTFGSCKRERQPSAFFPIDSLVTGQIQLLTSMQAGLFKEAILSGHSDSITYTPADTVAWLKELDIFRSLNIINKPINKGSYLVNDGLFDPGSNLTVKAFTSLKKLPVVYMRVYYQGNIDKPRKIEALYDDGNILYESARTLSLHFQQIDNKTILTSYTIRGGQKMMFGDSVAFYIKGRILVD